MVNSHLTYAILGVWNLSLTQFCLSIGATHKSRKTMKYVENISYVKPLSYDHCPSYDRQTSNSSTGKRLSFASTTMHDKKFMDADIIAIILAIVLQDLPFICLRLTLILK